MRIEAIDPIRDTDDDGTFLRLEPGDIKTVGPQFGKYACQMGWARDIEGKVPTGERRTGPVTVTPDKVIVEPEIETK